MNRDQKERAEKKFKFLTENFELAFIAFRKKESFQKILDGKDTPEGRILVNKARETIGFSPKTSSVDVFLSLKKYWKKHRRPIRHTADLLTKAKGMIGQPKHLWVTNKDVEKFKSYEMTDREKRARGGFFQ